MTFTLSIEHLQFRKTAAKEHLRCDSELQLTGLLTSAVLFRELHYRYLWSAAFGTYSLLETSENKGAAQIKILLSSQFQWKHAVMFSLHGEQKDLNFRLLTCWLLGLVQSAVSQLSSTCPFLPESGGHHISSCPFFNAEFKLWTCQILRTWQRSCQLSWARIHQLDHGCHKDF